MDRPKTIYDYYTLIYRPKHKRAVNEGYVPEQYLIAERLLNRELTPDEEVRHLNGDTKDNSPTNLEVFSMNAGFKTKLLVGSESYERADSATRTSMPCKFQRICWKEIRAPIARKHKVFLPYICSYQEMQDVYKCGHFWKFIDKELQAGEEG